MDEFSFRTLVRRGRVNPSNTWRRMAVCYRCGELAEGCIFGAYPGFWHTQGMTWHRFVQMESSFYCDLCWKKWVREGIDWVVRCRLLHLDLPDLAYHTIASFLNPCEAWGPSLPFEVMPGGAL